MLRKVIHHFCLSNNVQNSTAQSWIGRGSPMFPLTDLTFLDAQKHLFVNDSN